MLKQRFAKNAFVAWGLAASLAMAFGEFAYAKNPVPKQAPASQLTAQGLRALYMTRTGGTFAGKRGRSARLKFYEYAYSVLGTVRGKGQRYAEVMERQMSRATPERQAQILEIMFKGMEKAHKNRASLSAQRQKAVELMVRDAGIAQNTYRGRTVEEAIEARYAQRKGRDFVTMKVVDKNLRDSGAKRADYETPVRVLRDDTGGPRTRKDRSIVVSGNLNVRAFAITMAMLKETVDGQPFTAAELNRVMRSHELADAIAEGLVGTGALECILRNEKPGGNKKVNRHVAKLLRVLARAKMEARGLDPKIVQAKLEAAGVAMLARFRAAEFRGIDRAVRDRILKRDFRDLCIHCKYHTACSVAGAASTKALGTAFSGGM